MKVPVATRVVDGADGGKASPEGDGIKANALHPAALISSGSSASIASLKLPPISSSSLVLDTEAQPPSTPSENRGAFGTLGISTAD